MELSVPMTMDQLRCDGYAFPLKAQELIEAGMERKKKGEITIEVYNKQVDMGRIRLRATSNEWILKNFNDYITSWAVIRDLITSPSLLKEMVATTGLGKSPNMNDIYYGFEEYLRDRQGKSLGDALWDGLKDWVIKNLEQMKLSRAPQEDIDELNNAVARLKAKLDAREKK